MAFNEIEAQGAHYHKTGKDTVSELYEENQIYGHAFCYGSIKKYLKRLGKKGSNEKEIRDTAKKDLYKIANYAIIMLDHEYGEKYQLLKIENKNDSTRE